MPFDAIDPNLQAASHPAITGLFLAAVVLYGMAAATSLLGGAYARFFNIARTALGFGIAAHLASAAMRGWVIGYFPLTNKFESFSTCALAVAIVLIVAWRPDRLFTTGLFAILGALLYTAWGFGQDLAYPNPLLITIWYPLHVPLSFLCYGIWAAAGAAGVTWFVRRDPAWLRLVDKLALQGLGLWSLSMIFGGIWGVVAWGAYFLWDVKIIWSVILWFHYASFVHLRLTPSLRTRPWVRPALAVLGVVWVFVAYVGTSFLFGNSSHAF